MNPRTVLALALLGLLWLICVVALFTSAGCSSENLC